MTKLTQATKWGFAIILFFFGLAAAIAAIFCRGTPITIWQTMVIVLIMCGAFVGGEIAGIDIKQTLQKKQVSK